MESKKYALPLWRYKKGVDAKKVNQRILHDTLEWGFGDLPPVEKLKELPDFWHDLSAGKNIFHRVPRLRPVTTARLLPVDLEMENFFLLRPAQQFVDELTAAGITDSLDMFRYLDSKNALIQEHLHPFIRKFGIDTQGITNVNNSIKKISIYNYIEKSDLFIYIHFHNNSSRTYTIFVNDEEDGLKSANDGKNYSKTDILSKFIDPSQTNIPVKYICLNAKIEWTIVPFVAPVPVCPPLTELLEADNRRLRLPALSAALAHDRDRGLWDVWWPDGEEPEKQWYVAAELKESCVARDPWQDVQNYGEVCIDFGTSSTVAAVRESDNSVRLLRLDVSGMEGEPGEAVDPYENPTALEFANLRAALEPWRNEPQRPLVEWKHVKCSHLARNELRQGLRAESGIQAIKTWARALPGSFPVWLRDEQGADFELSPLSVGDTAESSDWGDLARRALDPIELYAYFLGIACNNQAFFGGRIYCDYTMTFPVKFPREVRQRILQGFRRGLVRSLPGSLTSSHRWKEKSLFRLRERASEPTAFAASVLPWLGIVPTDGGVPFAVFDFGGGTTDFAFGLWRLPTPEERAVNPWEQVLDILDVTGDENLGGEHLLELLAYELLRGTPDNRTACIAAGVTFTPPRDETLFDGSELLFTASREARANTVTLCELLRPLWEGGRLADDDTGLLQANFLDREGKSVATSLSADAEALLGILRNRIRRGVNTFFTAFAQAFKVHGIYPQELHVLLAGNSCRSPLVREAFEARLAEIVPNERDTVVIHDEMLPGGAKDASRTTAETGGLAADGSIAPTLKTGVALGLLRLLPGEFTGMVERNRAEESPFLYAVGTFSSNVLKPVLKRNADYGQWHAVGRVFREGVFLLGYTLAPEALEEQCPRSACRQLRLEWGEENFGNYLFIKAVSPDTIAVGLGETENGTPDEAGVRTLTLEG